MPSTIEEGYLPDPPEAVFDLLAGCRNELRWHPDVKAMEKVSDGPFGPGTEFEGVYRLFGPTRVRITEYDRPRLLDFDARGRTADIRVRLELRPEGNGARL